MNGGNFILQTKGDASLDTLSLHVMNTNYYIALPKEISKNWKQPIEQWIQYVAAEWSRFQKGNELAKLNQLEIGKTIQVSTTLFDCLKRANDYYVQTEGLFSPYLKIQMEQHGYNQSFPFQHANNHSIQPLVNGKSPILFLDNKSVLKTGEQQIDLGGFAKGYVVENIAQWLQQETSSPYGIVDGGGDMKVWSTCDKEWTIGIENPYNNTEESSTIKIKNGAIATSNRMYRSWKQGSERKHHLLNGQTGEVAKTDVIQATVVTKSVCDAEVISKLCFLMNDAELTSWLEKNDKQSGRYIMKENESGYWIKGGQKRYVH